MYTTQGIIIKKEDKGENDRLLTLFSREYGKIKILAKSVRKNTSKLASHLDVFSFVELDFVLGKAYKVLTSASEIESFNIAKMDLEKIKTVSHISELLEKYTLFEEKDEDVFELAFLAVSYLNKRELKKIELEYFLRYFEFKFLSVLGYEPQEKEVLEFFSSKAKNVNVNELEKIRLVFLRYF